MPVDDPAPDPTEESAEHYTEDPHGEEGKGAHAPIPDGGGPGPEHERPPLPDWLRGT